MNYWYFVLWICTKNTLQKNKIQILKIVMRQIRGSWIFKKTVYERCFLCFKEGISPQKKGKSLVSLCYTKNILGVLQYLVNLRFLKFSCENLQPPEKFKIFGGHHLEPPEFQCGTIFLKFFLSLKNGLRPIFFKNNSFEL